MALRRPSSSHPSSLRLQVAEKTWTCAALPLGGPCRHGPSGTVSVGVVPTLGGNFRNIQSRWFFYQRPKKEQAQQRNRKSKETWSFHRWLPFWRKSQFKAPHPFFVFSKSSGGGREKRGLIFTWQTLTWSSPENGGPWHRRSLLETIFFRFHVKLGEG